MVLAVRESDNTNDLVLIHTDGYRNPISETPILMATITKTIHIEEKNGS